VSGAPSASAKIGVHTGMLGVARTPDQLAAVIAHEIAHVLADHSNERLTQELAVQGGLMLVDLFAEEPGSLQHEMLRQALGIGAEYGLLLPYSRTHEREADRIGRDLMAQAGFDPRASVTLWRNMAAAGGGQPLAFLSTHPSHDNRMEELAEGMEQAVEIYRQARAAGREPGARRREADARRASRPRGHPGPRGSADPSPGRPAGSGGSPRRPRCPARRCP
jgi:predicted Zn-dependent protease